MLAERHEFDIWQVEMQVYPDGTLTNVKNKQRQVMRDGTGQNLVILDSLMTNYLGIGLDAKIAMEVEQRRKASRCLNNCSYFCLGVQNVFSRNLYISELLHRFERLGDDGGAQYQVSENLKREDGDLLDSSLDSPSGP